MRWLYKLPLRFRSLFERGHVEQELSDELRFHLEKLVEEKVAKGMTPEGARYAALRELGGVEQIKEECRDMRRVNYIENLIQDIRFGIRTLAKSPGVTVVAIITLALGIGANTAIFTLLDSVLLRNLPVRDPARLVSFADNPRESMSLSEPSSPEDSIGQSGQWTLFSYPMYEHFRDHSKLLEGVCAFQTPEDTLSVRFEGPQHGAAQLAQGKLVSGNFFSVLGVSAALGRPLTPEDDRTGAPPVAVVSFEYWRSKLGSEAGVLGRIVDIDNVPMTLVGVMPPGFFGERVTPDSADFWMPLSLRPQLTLTVMPGVTSLLTNPNAYWLGIMGRLKPGATRAQANAEVDGELRQYLMAQGGDKLSAHARQQIEHSFITLAPGGRGLSSLRFNYAEPLRILLAIVGLVLLIACANVANLLLARAEARQQEMAMRLALGASRGRVVRQLLVESVLLAALGGVAGALLAAGCVRVLVSLFAAKVPLNVKPDLMVFGFTLLVMVLAAVLSGLFPALKSTHVQLIAAIKGGSPAPGAQSSRLGLGKSLVTLQVAVSLLLLVGAGLLIRSLTNLENQNLGFNPQPVLLASINPELAGYKSEQLPGLYRELLERIRALPGVRSASIGTTSPMSGGESSASISFENPVRPSTENTAQLIAVGPQYFETEGMRMVAGRGISSEDTAHSTPIAVVNQAFARHFLSKENSVGKRFSLGVPFKAPGFEIVGIVEDAKYGSAREQAEPIFFLPVYQVESILSYVREIEIRAEGDPAAVTGEVRDAIQGINPNLPVDATTLSQQVNDSLAQQRAFSGLTGFFGILGLVLACVGLYGVMAHNVTRRTKEMGIRMALGAQKNDVLWMVLRQTLLLIGIGIAVGVPVALAAARLIASQLYGLKPSDPSTIVSATLVMAGVGLLAGYLPARRATKVDPMVALRYE
ncbi:MAG TPA: ABC transporter permease [Terriglobia bacterium]|nr:ABC transporter permease [Terriglobia bacterium]